MTEEDALIGCICRDWWEDLPWLVYADWLEERGEPLRAEYLRLHAALRPDVLPDKSAYTPAREAGMTRWCDLRYRLLDPGWVVRLTPLWAAPPGLSGRGREAVRVIHGVLVRRRELRCGWARAFYRPDEAPALGVDASAVGAGTALLVERWNAGAAGNFVPMPVSDRWLSDIAAAEIQRALRSGGFSSRPLSRRWLALDDLWAEPVAPAGPVGNPGSTGS